MQAIILDSQEIMQAIGAGELGLLLACSVRPVRQQIPGSTPSAPTFEPGGVQEPSGDKVREHAYGVMQASLLESPDRSWSDGPISELIPANSFLIWLRPI
jgi:hypothetical protein